ncbi:MAG: DNA alkylation repair protein [Taibaiella sp.]|nr:DNA alkylation repair protein [Taibaiella sp.]
MEPLKNMYHPAMLKQVGMVIENTFAGFSERKFVKDVLADNWDKLELKQRVRRISNSLHQQMPGKFADDISTLLRITEALHTYAGRDNTFEYIFLADYVEQYGLGHPKLAFDAMERITVLASCEYAVRPYIMADQASSLARMNEWTRHPHASVRRLASEGCRPRLPWGIALPSLKKQPAPVLPILEALKDDESEFVRRSVANNLNDIAKDNPSVVKSIAARWAGHSRERDKILKHGCRTLLKKGDAEVLSLFGVADNAACRVSQFEVATPSVIIGGQLEFSFSIVNMGDVDAAVRIEYEIVYAKAGGKTGRKIFKISEREIGAGAEISFTRRQSFADMTTRKHYAGAHTIAVVVNGVAKASGQFMVLNQ